MRDFPQELVDKVIDELFALVGRNNSYTGDLRRTSRNFRPVHGISDYSLVSRAWVGPTQKHHFSTLHLDCPVISKKWLARIPPDPTGVSRHVRKLVLKGFHLENWEDFGEHLCAFTLVEFLTVSYCSHLLHHPSILEWFLTMGPSLAELRIFGESIPPHVMTPLLAALPLLQNVEIRDCDSTDDMDCADDTNPPTPPRIPFFEGANRFTLSGWNYTADSLSWIPSSARFGHLVVDVIFCRDHPDLVNQWFASSSTTLTYLAIRGDTPYARVPEEPTSLNLSPCASLESLKISITPLVQIFLPSVTSTRLAKVILDLDGREGWRALKPGDSAFDVIEKHLCPVARRFSDAHPGTKMEVKLAGYFERSEWIRALKIINDRTFMPTLKEDANFVIPIV